MAMSESIQSYSNTRGGGVYIPPFKLAQMYESILKEKNSKSQEYQRVMWDTLKKSINGIINKANTSNISEISLELFNENLIRGKGLLVKSIMKSQMASPTFTAVYAAILSIINSKLPDIGKIACNRYISMFQKAFKRNSKINLQTSLKMIAHLVNNQIVTDILAFEILLLFLENYSADSIDLACDFMKECGQTLESTNPSIAQEVYEKFRSILHEGNIEKRSEYSIEALFAVRRSNYKSFPALTEELDLVLDDDKIMHNISLQDEIKCNYEAPKETDDTQIGTEEYLDNFRFEPNYDENEEEWNKIKLEIIGEADALDLKKERAEAEALDAMRLEVNNNAKIIDMTEKDLVNLKKTIYLTIISSLDFQECCHKLLKLNLRSGQEIELVGMIIDCCIQERTYEKFFGLLSERFCVLNEIYKECFEAQFETHFFRVHRLETNKLRNLAYLFVHLLYTKAISWSVLSIIRLTEEDTTTSSRIFIKTIFLELAKYLGIEKLSTILLDQTISYYVKGLFIKSSDPKETRFCINYFTSIGLGALTEDLRAYLDTCQALVEKTEISSESESENESANDEIMGDEEVEEVEQNDDEDIRKVEDIKSNAEVANRVNTIKQENNEDESASEYSSSSSSSDISEESKKSNESVRTSSVARKSRVRDSSQETIINENLKGHNKNKDKRKSRSRSVSQRTRRRDRKYSDSIDSRKEHDRSKPNYKYYNDRNTRDEKYDRYNKRRRYSRDRGSSSSKVRKSHYKNDFRRK